MSKFAGVVADLAQCGFLQDVTELETDVYRANETVGWRNVARELAAQLPGQTRALSSGGAAWQCGRTIGGTIVPSEAARRVIEARAIVGALGANPDGKPMWSLGTCARACLSFVGARQPYDPRAEEILRGHPYGYHECTPGEYKAATVQWLRHPARDLFDEETGYANPDWQPPVTLWDVSSFYYDLFRRLPSLRVCPLPNGRIRFLPSLPDDRARWRDVLQAVGECKPLRNSIAGAAAGSMEPGTAYTSARPKAAIDPRGHAEWVPGTVRLIHPPGMPGPFRAAGLLVVSTAAELTRMEAEYSNAVYANVDSVALRGNAEPAIWHRFGFKVSIRAQGEAEICHRGSWKIGPRDTGFYRRGFRHHVPTPRTHVDMTYNHQWL